MLPHFRNQARSILIRTYFEPHEQIALWSLAGISPPAEYIPEPLPGDNEAIERGREGRFRIGVVTAYNYTCALTGYRLLTITPALINYISLPFNSCKTHLLIP